MSHFIALQLLIVSFSFQVHCHIERFDGWYNNLGNPEWGGVGDEIIYDVPPAYSDLTYLPSGADRPNPRVVSNHVMAGHSGLPSYANRTALSAFFGQLVAYEVVHAADTSCPVELIKVPVPEDDTEFINQTSGYMPFTRSSYKKSSGQAPNNPRKPTNRVSSWLDGSSIYGRGEVWCNCLRSFSGGQLTAQNTSSGFPGYNKIRLPLDNFPSPVTHDTIKPEHLWMFGDSHIHQNPGLMAMALVWFRYHNHVAQQVQKDHPDWRDDKVFTWTRQRVVATLQSIIAYEWLPSLLGKSLPPYTGYKPHVKPSISVMFEAAAFRLGHSQIPPGIYIRDKGCNFESYKPIRLCNSYWHSQELLDEHGLEAILMGMASQIAEREDHLIVDDLRGKTFGPLHYSRHDLAVLTLMRGRDHGLPDYNTARVALGLPRITKWKDINPWLFEKDPTHIDNLRKTYRSLAKVDVYPAGMLEATPSGPGPLFMQVILDQFTRIRDGDRYWFENNQNAVFSEDEVSEIRSTTFRDVLLAATDLDPKDIQKNVFFWKQGDVCGQPRQLVSSDMEPCTPHQGYDYFTGSEVSYITAFTSLCLVPFLCMLVAYLLSKCKRKQQTFMVRRWSIDSTHSTASDTFSVHEWSGHRLPSQQVTVHLDSSVNELKVISGRKTLRVIHVQRYDNLKVWVSNDKWKDFILIHVPREYDLVLRFNSESERHVFLDSLKHLLRTKSKTLHMHEHSGRDIMTKAITKEKREALITKFFKNIFMEAHHLGDIELPDELQLRQCKEMVECELSRQEFAEALALKPDSVFVDQMFSVIDRDGNGYISFRELLYAVLLFAKGSCEDKLQLLFAMYDRDKSGTLNREEVQGMITSMLEMANTNIDPVETQRMVDEMFVTAGLQRRSSLAFQEFTQVLSGQMHMLWDVCLDFKGTKICMPKKKGKKKKSEGGPPAISGPDRIASFEDATVRTPDHASPLSIQLRILGHYLENHRRHIVYVFLFFCVTAIIFTERFYYFAVEQEHTGLRSLTGYGLSVTRGAAAAMSFTFSLLLLTVCRNTITKLRETVLNLYVPFDSNVAFHKLVAYTALFFTLLHIVGYCFNFYHVATQPVQFLCVIDEIFFRSDFLPKLHFWLFQNLTGMTGILLVLVICIMYIFASQTARTHIFNAFWISHQLFYVLYILTLLHGCARLVQEPYFPYYFIGPAIIFMADKLVSLSQKKKVIGVIRAEVLPSDVTMLEFKRPSNFEYRSGQWVRVACESLGGNEYHALTLTSAPHEENLSVHIRGIGPWTKNIYKTFDPANLRDQPYPKLFIDGPFGAGQQDWFRYDVSVLVGGGIGITPYASILKDFVFMTSVRSTHRLKCQKLYFVWVTASHKHFEWFIDILRQAEEVDTKGVLETHIFITQLFQKFDLRTTMLYICEEHFQRMSGRSMFSGLKAKTHFGRPDFDKVLDAVHARHPKTKKVGVFSCGPPGLTKGVQRACYSSTKRDKTSFEHHFENF